MNKYAEIQQHPYFQEMIEIAKKKIPIVPDYDPGDPLSGEQMKALSLKRQGFLLALTFLTGVRHD